MLQIRLKTAALAAIFVLAVVGVVEAAPARIMHDARVFSQPTPRTRVVNWVEAGQNVEVIAIEGHWARVQIPGRDGWVQRRILAPIRARAPRDRRHRVPVHPDYFAEDYPEDYAEGEPRRRPGFEFCLNGSNTRFCLGN